MSTKINIKDLDISKRPREMLIQKGSSYLSDDELLAILIDTGTKEYNAIQIARQLIDFAGDISYLAKFDVNTMKNVKGIGTAKACKIVAAIEFASRVVKNSTTKKDNPITNPKQLVDIFRYEFERLNIEVFKIICLNAKNNIIYEKNLTIGVANMSVITAREVYKEALLRHSSSIIVMHNHPSKNPPPSSQDIQITKKLSEGGRFLDIPLFDHIIYGSAENFYSFKENGYL